MKSPKEILIRRILLKELELFRSFDEKRLVRRERKLYKEKSRLLSKILFPFKFILRILRCILMEIVRQVILISIGLVFIFPLTNLTILRHNKIYEGIDKLVEFNLWDASRFKR